MRKFDYFLFDNYDNSDIKHERDNPRFVLNEGVDVILNEIIDEKVGEANYANLCDDFGKNKIDDLIDIGLIKEENGVILIDSPIFIEEDTYFLQTCFENSVKNIISEIDKAKKDFYNLSENIVNGFSVQENLYHILCGAIFDGYFFDFISEKGLVSTSRIHKSGLDYIIVVYEKSEKLDRFSRKLLCSYNRYSDGKTTLQSFGDADGNRVDFFRFSKLLERKDISDDNLKLKNIEKIWVNIENKLKKSNKLYLDKSVKTFILEELNGFLLNKNCDNDCMSLFREFNYIKANDIAVPVFKRGDFETIMRIEKLLEETIYHMISEALASDDLIKHLYCNHHGVDSKEIYNELYHVLFGQINQGLVDSRFVANPNTFAGQGRYLKSIEIY